MTNTIKCTKCDNPVSNAGVDVCAAHHKELMIEYREQTKNWNNQLRKGN